MMRLHYPIEVAASVWLFFQVKLPIIFPILSTIIPDAAGNWAMGLVGGGFFFRVYWLQTREIERLQNRIITLERGKEENEKLTLAKLVALEKRLTDQETDSNSHFKTERDLRIKAEDNFNEERRIRLDIERTARETKDDLISMTAVCERLRRTIEDPRNISDLLEEVKEEKNGLE